MSSGAWRRRCASPALHAQFAAVDERGLAGYILARMLEGEFGRSAAQPALELVGVRPDIARPRRRPHLFDALVAMGRPPRRRPNCAPQAAWRDAAMLHWLDAHGLRAGAGADRRMRRRAVATTAPSATTRSTLPDGDGAGATRSISARRAGNDFERLARDSCRRALDDGGRPAAASCASTAASPAATAATTSRPSSAEALDDSSLRVSLVRAPRRRDRRLPDGARRPRRLRPHRAGGRDRHDRRRSATTRAAASAARCCRNCSSTSARCASSASRPWSRRATSALLGFLLRRRLRAVAAAAVRAPPRHGNERGVMRPTACMTPDDVGARRAAPGRRPRGRHEHRRTRPGLRHRGRRRRGVRST